MLRKREFRDPEIEELMRRAQENRRLVQEYFEDFNVAVRRFQETQERIRLQHTPPWQADDSEQAKD